MNVARGQSRDLSWLITDFTDRVPDVVHAVVVSADGVCLAASEGIWPEQLDHLSAITAGLASLAQGSTGIAERGDIVQTLVSMEHAAFVIMAISDGSSLAALAGPDADLDQVAYEMTILTEQAGRVLTPRLRQAAGTE